MLRTGRRGTQHEAGLRDCDRRGACHPGLRRWDRNPGPVYGAPWPQPPLFRDSDRGLWSLPRPPDPLVGRALSPRAAEGTATQGRLWGPSAITCSPHVPAPTKDLGRGGASSPGQGKEGFLSSIVKPPVPAKSGRFHGSSVGLWPGEGKVHQNRFFKLPMRVKSGRNGRTSLTSKARNSGAGELRPPRARPRANPHRTGPSPPVPLAVRSQISCQTLLRKSLTISSGQSVMAAKSGMFLG